MSPRGGWQRWRAMTRASMQSPALRCSAMDQPTISRVARSLMAARYKKPSSVGMYEMSANHTVSGRSATKERPSKFGATGRSWRLSVGWGRRRRPRLGRRPLSPTTLGLQAHVAHQPFDAPACVAVPLAVQLGVDAGRAIDPALGRKDAAD